MPQTKNIQGWSTPKTGKPVPPTEDANSSLDFADWGDRKVTYQEPPPEKKK